MISFRIPLVLLQLKLKNQFVYNVYYVLLQIFDKYKKYLTHTSNPANIQINYIKLLGFEFNETAILVIVFWNIKVFKYRFNSPKVKRNLISAIGCRTTSNIGSQKIINHQQQLKFDLRHCPALLPQIKTWQQHQKNTKLYISSVPSPVQLHWINSKDLVLDCLNKKSFNHDSAQSPPKPQFLYMFYVSKAVLQPSCRFFGKASFLNQISTFSRNFNHHWKEKSKKNFQAILIIIFCNFKFFSTDPVCHK